MSVFVGACIGSRGKQRKRHLVSLDFALNIYWLGVHVELILTSEASMGLGRRRPRHGFERGASARVSVILVHRCSLHTINDLLLASLSEITMPYCGTYEVWTVVVACVSPDLMPIRKAGDRQGNPGLPAGTRQGGCDLQLHCWCIGPV